MKKLSDYKEDYNKLSIKKNLFGNDALEAVKQSGEVLQFVQTQTEAICLEAVKQSGEVLKYVSAEIFNKLENKSDMIEIDGKKISKSTISEALKNYFK